MAVWRPLLLCLLLSGGVAMAGHTPDSITVQATRHMQVQVPDGPERHEHAGADMCQSMLHCAQVFLLVPFPAAAPVRMVETRAIFPATVACAARGLTVDPARHPPRIAHAERHGTVV